MHSGVQLALLENFTNIKHCVFIVKSCSLLPIHLLIARFFSKDCKAKRSQSLNNYSELKIIKKNIECGRKGEFLYFIMRLKFIKTIELS